MLKELKFSLLILLLISLIENSNAIEESYDEYMARIEYHSTELSWDDAKKTCEDKGSYIVTPYSVTENLYLIKNVPSANLWIGLSKKDGASWASFSNGKRVDGQYTYTRWNTNEPNGGATTEKCIELYFSINWNDKGCGNKRTFYCYRKPKILMNDEALSYDDAINSCEKIWTAKSWFDIQYANSLANGKSFYTGSYKKSVESPFSSPYGVNANFQYAIGSQTGCSYSDSSDHFDVTSNCYQKKLFFCEISKPHIERKYESYDQYMSRIELQDIKNWDDAKKTCESKDSRLVTPYSDIESEYISDKTPEQNVWLGLRRDSDGKFKYFNGQILDNIYSNWDYPNEPSGDGACIHRWKSGVWNDQSCLSTFKYFCYKKPEIYLSRQQLSYDEAKKSCGKLFTVQSWYDLEVANKIAGGKSFWTGTQKTSALEIHRTPDGITNCFTNSINNEIGCSYSNDPNKFLVTSNCDEKMYFLCHDSFSPTKNPTKSPTNKPTNKPTNTPTNKPTGNYLKPIIMPIPTKTVPAGGNDVIELFTKQIIDSTQSYGDIKWSIESSQNTLTNSWLSIFSVNKSGAGSFLVITPPADFKGYYWAMLTATNPNGDFDTYPIVLNITPKQTN